MTIISEFVISEKSSVPWIVMSEFLGIAFEISKASPRALLLVRFSNIMSSKEFDAQRNAIEEPTRPLPIIEIS
jgi:hypothetical protein